MKHKLLKLNVVLLLGLFLAPLKGQTTMTVKETNNTKSAYTLNFIRKLTFPVAGKMAVSKFIGGNDAYALTNVRYLNFKDLSNIADAAKGILYLYPNPAVDVLNIQLSTPGSQNVFVEFLSIDGKVLYKAQLTGIGIYEVNVSQFRQGIYLCRVNNGTNIETTKFFKQ